MVALLVPSPVRRAPRTAPVRGVRPEIQSLRALAVALVVIYHVWPAALPGGFIGLDVFFVISGFLITALLLREIERTGKLSLSAFWARRARRILPAALFTVLVCVIATIVFVPINLWPQYLSEMRASTAYVQNWQLASEAADYFAVAQDSAVSPVQHFWSLSVEEQFYLLWPVLLLAVARRRRALVVAMAGATALSFAHSLVETAANPAAAYFVTPTRAWEFGAGGLLALAGTRTRPSPLLCGAGLAAIAAGALAFTARTPFPGFAALVPVLGAVAVIRAGPAGRALAVRPVQWLGDISYSVYLWHRPLLVLAPFALPGELHNDTRIAIVMLTLMLAWLCKRLIEDPVRGCSLTGHRPARTFATAVAASAAVLAPIAGAAKHVEREQRASEQQTAAVLASGPRCFGAASMDPAVPCRNPRLRLSVIPTPLQARTMEHAQCRELSAMLGKRICEFGVTADKATSTVVLVGDSHAGMWRVALDAVVKARGWRGVHLGHASCPLSTAVRDIPEPNRSHCTRWRRLVFAWFTQHTEASTLFVSQLSGGLGVLTRGSQSQAEAQVAGYRRAWLSLPPSVKHIVVIHDTPKVKGFTAACVQRAIAHHRPAGRDCAVPRAGAIDPDYAAAAAARLRSPRVAVIDLNRFICDRSRCYPVIGGALVHKDSNHILAPFMQTLAPYLERALDRLAAAW